jgi:hypothetical protein
MHVDLGLVGSVVAELTETMNRAAAEANTLRSGVYTGKVSKTGKLCLNYKTLREHLSTLVTNPPLTQTGEISTAKGFWEDFEDED